MITQRWMDFRPLLLTLALSVHVALVFPSLVQAQVLWSVQSHDGQRNWLLGTVHSEDPRLLDFPPELLDALAQSQRLALELVPDMAMLETLNQAMNFPQPRLPELLESELYQELVRIMESEYGMGEPAVRHLRPWAAAMTISIPPPQTGLFMDLALAVRARSLGLEVIALERLEEQLDFLAGMSEPMQIELLRRAVNDFPRQGELFEDLMQAYLSADLDRLEAVALEQMSQLDPDLRRHFEQIGMVQRNHTMVERAVPMLEQGGLMIAVGALHLPGQDGLIALLREAGFTLEPVATSIPDP